MKIPEELYSEPIDDNSDEPWRNRLYNMIIDNKYRRFISIYFPPFKNTDKDESDSK